MAKKKDGFVGNRDSGKGDRQLDPAVPKDVLATRWDATWGERPKNSGYHVYKFCRACDRVHEVRSGECLINR